MRGNERRMKPTLGLKGLIEEEAILVMPGLYDGVSAVLAQKAGFRAVCSGGGKKDGGSIKP